MQYQHHDKIVHIVYSFGVGGLEKVILNLINNSHDYKAKHIIISLTPELSLTKQLESNVDVYCLAKKPGNDIITHIKLYRLLKRIKPIAVHTYNFGTIEYNFTAWLAGVAIRVHCDHGRGGDDPKGMNKLNNAFRRFISHWVSRYIVVSYDLFDWIANKIKVNKDKLSLFFNGVEVPPLEESKPVHQPFIFTTVGRIDPVKNQKLLIDAFCYGVENFESFNETELWLVGEGPLYDELSEYIEQKQAYPFIKMLGVRSDIRNILQQTDVFVLSSNYEAMPMTILEAMSENVPVICTNVGGISRFISEQEAWFVEPGDIEALANKMAKVKSSEQERKIKTNAAYRLVDEKYSVSHMVDAYMQLYGATK